MSVNAVILGLGAILLLIGILGGGFEIKEFKVPKVGPAPRVISAVGGIFFVLLGMGLETTDAAAKKSGPDTLMQPATAVQPGSPLSPVEFTIYDHLAKGQVTEQATVLIDGRIKGQLTVDVHNPESMLVITVPASGRYSYTVESKTVVQEAGGLYEYQGAGQGMINVQDGKKFEMTLTPSGNTWLVTLMDDAARAAQQN